MVSETLRQLEMRRRSLGMSKRALAERAGVSVPTVRRILLGQEESPSLRSVEAIAHALGAEVTVGIQFIETPRAFKERQATEKARRLVGMVQGTMGLESQAVDQATIDGMVENSAEELLRGSRHRLWAD